MAQPPISENAGLSSGAGFWIRALARIIDIVYGNLLGLISGFLAGIVLVVLEIIGFVSPGWAYRIQPRSFVIMGLSILGAFLYHTLCEGIHGASLGKLICGLRVIQEDGRSSTLLGAVVRSLGWFVDAFFFGLVAYSSMAKSPLNQRYGDVWGKTIVVKKKDFPVSNERTTLHFIAGLFLGTASWIVMLILGTVLEAI
jgi:uncharacterized RDD family membrane protein YckC